MYRFFSQLLKVSDRGTDVLLPYLLIVAFKNVTFLVLRLFKTITGLKKKCIIGINRLEKPELSQNDALIVFRIIQYIIPEYKLIRCCLHLI